MAEIDEFWNFLGAWFPDADLEGTDDDIEVVHNFLKTGNTREIAYVLAGCEQVLSMNPLPTKRISDEANRYFANESDCKSWLEQLRKALTHPVQE
jgi:hypothetical protein